MSIWVVLFISAAYLGILYAVAQLVEHNRENKRLAAAQGWVYALSIAVYCTSWTYYGSVGRSVKTGIGFLPIYIGPILVFVLGSALLRKMLRIAKTERATSIADFIASRYGKSYIVAGIVTVICLIGIMPYIALQLEAVSNTFNLLLAYPEVKIAATSNPFYADSTFYIALLIGLFVIVFGTRRVDVTEQHHGMIAAIAFESVIKVVAFLAVGCFVTFGLFGGFNNLFTQAAANAKLAPLLNIQATLGKVDFWALTVLAGLAIVCLPRQFQVIFVENTSQDHLKPARWIFPAYLVIINIFVMPIALAGVILLADKGANPDTFVLTLPVFGNNASLALFAFIGGLSAATGMIAVEAIALSTMVCNDLVMPLLIHTGVIDPKQSINFGSLVMTIRRVAIIFIVLIGCAYSKLIGGSYALVSIGLISFVASAQFAPSMLIGLYWKRGNQAGAIAGLSVGFLIWLYTLLLPSFAKSGWLPAGFLEHGLTGIEMLRPYALFGVTGLDPITHGLMWSLLGNIVSYIAVSLVTKQSADDRAQALAYVDVFKSIADTDPLKSNAPQSISSTPVTASTLSQETSQRIEQNSISVAEGVKIADLVALLERFVGAESAKMAFTKWCNRRNVELDLDSPVDLAAIKFTEGELTGVVGAASAQKMMTSIAQFGKNSHWLNPLSTKMLKK